MKLCKPIVLLSLIALCFSTARIKISSEDLQIVHESSATSFQVTRVNEYYAFRRGDGYELARAGLRKKPIIRKQHPVN